MWVWVRRVGLMIMIVSSVVIGLPIVQYEVCGLNLGLKHDVVSVKHCSYVISHTAILVLVFGNILFVVAYLMQRIRK